MVIKMNQLKTKDEFYLTREEEIKVATEALSKSTRATYQMAYKTFLRYYGQNEEGSCITQRNIISFIQRVPKKWRKSKNDLGIWCYEETDKPLSIQTVSVYVSALIALAYIIDNVDLKNNQAIQNALKILRRDGHQVLGNEGVKAVFDKKKRALPLSICDVDNFCSNEFNNIRDRVLIALGFFTASRANELASLNVGDVEFKDNGAIIHIRKSKTDQQGNGFLKFIPAAPSNALWCPVKLLKQYIQDVDQDDPVFITNTHNRMTTRDISRVITKHFPNHTSHSLRAGSITFLAENGKSLSEIQEVSGHRSVGTVARYVRRTTGIENSPTHTILDAISQKPTQSLDNPSNNQITLNQKYGDMKIGSFGCDYIYR